MNLPDSTVRRGPLRSSLLLGLALAAAPSGCGAPLVGGACADGYDVQGGQCVVVPDAGPEGTTNGSATGSAGGPSSATGAGGSTSSATGAGGSSAGCAPGLTACLGACVDVDVDPDDCGTCGTACVMAACLAGVCTTGVVEAGAVGDAVILGLDFSSAVPGDAAARLLGNAVYLTVHDPVRILDYRELTTWNASAVTNTVDLIADGAMARGRTVETSVAAQWADVPLALSSAAYDVLFVHDLDAAQPGQLAGIGAAWSTSMLSFVKSGGVVVVVATDSGVNEMGQFLSSSRMFHVDTMASATSESLVVQGTADAIGAGLVPNLGALPGSASFVAAHPPGPSLAYVVVTSGQAPVVVHRAWY